MDIGIYGFVILAAKGRNLAPDAHMILSPYVAHYTDTVSGADLGILPIE